MGVPMTSAEYPPPVYYPAYPSPDAPPSDAQRVERRWMGWCFTLAVVSLALFIPLLGVAQGVASQFAVGFGGFLLVAAVPALLLTLVNVAFVLGTRPRR
jgi:hypothetical protein